MYPQRELRELARHKARLRTVVATQRAGAVEVVGRILRPVVAIDRVVDKWRRLPAWVRLFVGPVAGFALRRVLSDRRAPRGRRLRLPAALALALALAQGRGLF
jgi:hypothetical protein